MGKTTRELGCRSAWTPAVFALILMAICGFLFCPPSRFHSRSPGQKRLWEPPRYLAAVATGAGELAASIQFRGKANINVCLGRGRLTRITAGNLDADPAWDRAGTRIAYVSLGDRGKLALRVHDLARGSDTQLLERPLISQPQWSHDGARVFFLQSRPDVIGQSTIYAMDLQTRRITSHAQTDYNRPQAWGLMADDRLVYAYKGAVWTKDVGKPAERLPLAFTNPCMVSATPNNRLLFVCDSRSASGKLAILVDLSTLQTKQVYSGYIRYALWSPSGRFLAIVEKEETKVFTTSSAASIQGWHQHAVLQGNAVCWRTGSSLVLIRPGKISPRSLEEADVNSGVSTRIAP